VQSSEYERQSTSKPIDGGQVAQAVVEYTGSRLGAVTFRGPSGREYRFSASPSESRRYVLSEDIEHFRQLRDFRVLAEGRIDPEDEKLTALARSISDRVRGEVIEHLEHVRASEPRPRSRRRGGRPAGKGFGAWLDCLMTCGGLKAYYGSPEAAYGAIYRYLGEHSPPCGYIPPRERFASARSYAKCKREGAGIPCFWYRHPEPVPRELLPG
jgi:hypothetical protein